MSLYKDGMTLAEKQDSKGAMEAFTEVIERVEAPNDVKAMALYNRALIFASEGKTDKASADLKAVMELPIPSNGVKVAAKRRLERLQHRREAADKPIRRKTT